MKYLSDIAARELLWAVRANFSAGFVSWTETLDRLVALHDMARPGSSTQIFAVRLLRLEGWPIDTDWGSESNEPSRQADDEEATSSQILRMPRKDNPGSGEDSSIDWVYFASSVSGLQEWEFHQYDADPHPSVPHGHKRTSHRWKLDAYQGWVYLRSRQDHRSPRWKIVALWNDRKFRAFALDSIQYHLDNHPHHRDWPVINPRRLPRRR